MDWPGSGPAPVARETTAGLAVGSLLVARGEDCRMARGLSTTSSPLCCRTRADFSGSGPGRPRSASARLSAFFSTAASGSVEGAGCPAEELGSAAAGFQFEAHSAAASGPAEGVGGSAEELDSAAARFLGRPRSASARPSVFFSTAASGSVEDAGCPAEELDSAAARYLYAAHPATASGSAAMAEAAAAGDSAAAVAEAAAAVDSAAAVRFLAHPTAAVR